MGAETARWVRELGLDVSKRPDRWQVEVSLATVKGSGKFTLCVWSSVWYVTVEHKSVYFIYRREDDCRPTLEGTNAAARKALTPPRSLATIRDWLARVEKKLGVQFRRDSPEINSTVKGGKPAMGAWIGAHG